MSWLWKGNDEVTFKTSADRKRQEKLKTVKWFVGAALIIALIAGIVLVNQYDFAKPEKVDDEAETTEAVTENVKYAFGKSTIMFYCTDSAKEKLLFMFVVHSDMENRYVKIHPISVSDKIMTYQSLDGVVTTNASVCFANGGASMLKNGCENYLGTKIDRYFGTSEGDFLNISANFTNISVNVTENVVLKRGKDTVSFTQGNHKLNDSDLIKYLSYSGRSADRMKADQAAVYETMVNKYLDEKYVENLPSIFSRIVNFSTTDISVPDITDNMRSFRFIANKDYGPEISSVIPKEEFVALFNTEADS